MSEDRRDRIQARAREVEAAGGSISKAALAREFGVSRQTVTKALERCVTCGRPSRWGGHCGYHVPPFECSEPFCRKVVHQKRAACSDHSEPASRMTRPTVEIERVETIGEIGRLATTRWIPREEVRSHFVTSRAEGVPSDTDPCKALEGVHWVWARSRRRVPALEGLAVGKWLIYVKCEQVSYCWGRVREATEEDPGDRGQGLHRLGQGERSRRPRPRREPGLGQPRHLHIHGRLARSG